MSSRAVRVAILGKSRPRAVEKWPTHVDALRKRNRCAQKARLLSGAKLCFGIARPSLKFGDDERLLICEGRSRRLRVSGCGLLRVFQSSPLDAFPGIVASEVLPHTLKAPINLNLTIREMFQKTVHQEPCHIAPVVVAAVRELLLKN